MARRTLEDDKRDEERNEKAESLSNLLNQKIVTLLLGLAAVMFFTHTAAFIVASWLIRNTR